MDYVVAGNIITNAMIYPDGSSSEDIIGGSGLYALCGVRLWTDDCLLVSNAGADFYDKYGKWFVDNGMSVDGVSIMSDHTVYQILKYRPDGVYDIDHEFGDLYGICNYGYLRVRPEDILHHSEGAKGVYMQYHADRMFFERLLEGKRKMGFQMLWEYLPSLSVPDPLPLAREILKEVDVFSINYPESCGMFGTDNEEEVIRAMKELNVPLILFRVGERGLYAIAEGEHWFVPSIGRKAAVDPTGCGNCSTGAALYAYCEGYSPLMTGIMANVAASYNVRQYGPFPQFTNAIRLEAGELAQQMYVTLSR